MMLQCVLAHFNKRKSVRGPERFTGLIHSGPLAESGSILHVATTFY